MRKTEGWARLLPAKLITDLERLPAGLLSHCRRASEVAADLARRFGYDPDRAKAAVMAHDITRALDDEELLALAATYGLKPAPIGTERPILIHGLLGAELLRREYGVADEEILEAIACHTAGRRDMGLLDKIVFLADKLDPEKVALRPELEAVNELAKTDLDGAVLEFFNLQLIDLVAKGLPIHPAMVEARNGILASC